MERKTGQISGKEYMVHDLTEQLVIEPIEKQEVIMKPTVWYHLPQIGEAIYRLRQHVNLPRKVKK